MRLCSRSASASVRRGVERRAGAAQGLARLPLRFGGLAQVLLGPFQRPPTGLHRRLCRYRLGLQLGEPVAARQPLGGSARRIGRGDIAVPAPQVALAADQTLSRPKHRLQAGAVGALDQAGEGETAGQHGRRPHMGGECGDALGQGAVFCRGVDLAPAGRGIVVRRGVEVVAEGGTERRFEAAIDRHRIDHRRVAGRCR